MTVVLDPAPDTTGLPDAERAERLQERLRTSLLALRRRATGRLDVEGRLGLLGGGLLVAGAVLVLLGWYGAAHTSRVYLQIPYLISGGLLGVVAAFAGGSLYFASWMTRLVQEERGRADAAAESAAEVAATLRRIEALLARAGGPEVAGPGRPGELVATPSGRLAHRPDCATVSGRHDLRRVDGGDGELAPCRMCQPELAASRNGT